MRTEVTVRIYRVQTTTIEIDQPLDPTQDLDQQLEDAGAWGVLSARLHEDSEIANISLLPAPTPVFPGDPYVIIEGGLVSNDPLLPVFDLDVLDADIVSGHDIKVAAYLAEQARAHGLTDIATRLERFVADEGGPR